MPDALGYSFVAPGELATWAARDRLCRAAVELAAVADGAESMLGQPFQRRARRLQRCVEAMVADTAEALGIVA